MKKNIGIAVLTLSFSSFIQAASSYGLDTAETMAHLVKMQKGSGFQSICTYRSTTRNYGVHEVQASMFNGCEQQLAYTATSAGGGVLRVFGTTNRYPIITAVIFNGLNVFITIFFKQLVHHTGLVITMLKYHPAIKS